MMLYRVYYFIDGEWTETNEPLTTTEAESNGRGLERSKMYPDYLYSVIEDGRILPHTIFFGGCEYTRKPTTAAGGGESCSYT